MKRQPLGIPSFYWQRGYGIFSVSGSHVDVVIRYIAHQNGHHRHLTYREEVDRLMKKYDVVEYNPGFYWD